MATLACLLRRWVVVFMDAVCSYRSVASKRAQTLRSRPFAVRFWDRTLLPRRMVTERFTVRTPAAVACALRAPRQLGIGRAYLAWLLEVDDLDAALDLLADWQPRRCTDRSRPGSRLRRCARAGWRCRPPISAAGLRPCGRRHSSARNARAARHHYDVSNEFFALFLALADRHEHRACRSIPARREDAGGGPPGEARVRLRLARARGPAGACFGGCGCGWGSFAIHCGATRGTELVGITLSEPQARFAQHRAARAGVADGVEIRAMGYCQLTGERFDAVASIGMVEHVGSVEIDRYAQRLRRSA